MDVECIYFVHFFLIVQFCTPTQDADHARGRALPDHGRALQLWRDEGRRHRAQEDARPLWSAHAGKTGQG